MSLTQRGFTPARKLGGGAAITKTFPVSAAANEAYFLGDAVIASQNGTVRPLKNASTDRPLGVIIGLLNSDKRPLTFNAPTTGPFLASAEVGFAYVNVDPQQTYIAEIGANVNDAVRFAAAKVSAGAPTTQTGLSGQSLSGTVSVSADSQFIIIGLAPEEAISGQTSAAAPAKVEVKMINPVFGTGTPI